MQPVRKAQVSKFLMKRWLYLNVIAYSIFARRKNEQILLWQSAGNLGYIPPDTSNMGIKIICEQT